MCLTWLQNSGILSRLITCVTRTRMKIFKLQLCRSHTEWRRPSTITGNTPLQPHLRCLQVRGSVSRSKLSGNNVVGSARMKLKFLCCAGGSTTVTLTPSSPGGPSTSHQSRHTASSKRYKYLRRILKFRQMDFEYAFWQMLYLFVSPQKV